MLSNVRLFLLDVVRIQHLLWLTVVRSVAARVRLLGRLLVVLLRLLLHRYLLLLLVLGLNRNLLLLVLRRLLLLIVWLLLRGLLIVLWRGWLILLLLRLLVMAGIYSGGNPLTECHRCKQRQG